MRAPARAGDLHDLVVVQSVRRNVLFAARGEDPLGA
jgi:hypothetical protein